MASPGGAMSEGHGIIPEGIIPRRMASPGGAMSEGHGIIPEGIILRRMASPGGAMSEGHGIRRHISPVPSGTKRT